MSTRAHFNAETLRLHAEIAEKAKLVERLLRVRWRHGGTRVRWNRRKPSDSKPRRRRPRHERLIIAMTLVVGAVWLVSVFRAIVVRLGGNYLVYFGGELYVYARNWDDGAVPALHYTSPEELGLRLRFPMHIDRPQDPGAWQAWLQSGMMLPLCATIFFFAGALPAVFRAAHRRRKKRCIGCGYSRDEQLERCPECGRLASEPSPGFWRLAWRAYRWPLACIAVNVAVTLVAIEVMN